MKKNKRDPEDINIIDPGDVPRATEGHVGQNEPLPMPWHSQLFAGTMLEKVRPCGMVLGGICVADFSTADYAGMVLASQATSPKTIDLDGKGEVTMDCIHFMVFADNRLDRETNEWVQDMKTVLFSKDGETFSTWSPYIARKITNIFDCVDRAELEKGIPIRIRKRASRQPGYSYHDLVLMPKSVEGS